VQEHGKWYVLAVSSTTPVWTERPAVIPPQELTGGRPRQLERLAPGAAKASTVAQVVASRPPHAWKRLSVGEGEKGLREYHWARAWVVESRDHLPGPDIWLLAHRSICDPQEIAYYLALAPRTTSLQTLAVVAATRYTVEQCIEEAKGETGLEKSRNALLAQLVPAHHG
jgi:hypothetical protein